MIKRSVVIFSILIILILTASAVILGRNFYIKPALKPMNDTLASASETKRNESSASESETSAQIQIVKSQDITVQNNTAEYDLKAEVYQNNQDNSFLKLDYYLDGNGTEYELGQDKLPELRDILNIGNSEVKCRVYLNTKNAKAYLVFCIENQTDEKNTSIYDFNLKDSSVRKIFSESGESNDLKFNKNLSYFAFNCKNRAYNQDMSFFEVVNCENDEVMVKNSKDSKGILVGNKKESGIGFSYGFISWASNSTVNLMETKYNTDKAGNPISMKEQNQKSYDVEKNLFLNDDGVVSSNTATVSTGSAAQVKAESGALKTLKSYYQYMSNGEYRKANGLLDDKFKLKLKIFKQFGINELSKSDMDENSISIYGSLFKTSKIQSIVDEKTNGSNSTIYFYLSYSMGESDQIVQPLTAEIVKSGKDWKILQLTDGNENESPFKNK